MARMHLAAFAASVIVATPSVASAQWDPEIQMTSTGSDVFGEGIAASGTTVHLIYGNPGVTYRRSLDEGKTWNAGKPVDDGILHLTDPIIADGKDVWMITMKDLQTRSDWCCPRELGNLYLVHSGDNGETWDTAKKLTTSQSAFRISMAYAAGRLHVVWMDYRANVWDTYYLRSPDRGQTWEPEKKIAASAGSFGAERPQVAARGDGVHVTIWDDRGNNPACKVGTKWTFTSCPDTQYVRSTDGGSTWGTVANVAKSGAAFAGRNDVAVAGTASVIINFNRAAENTDDANPHLFVVRSTDDGASWGTPFQLTNTPGTSDHGSIVGYGPSVHLAWHDSRDGKLGVYYVYSTDEGATWQPDERVSPATSAEASTPLDAATPGFVHVAWLDKRSGTNQIYYRRREAPVVPVAPDGGPTTGEPSPTGDGHGGPASSATPAESGEPDTGCGCELVGRRGRLPALAVAAMAIVLAVVRRRRRG